LLPDVSQLGDAPCRCLARPSGSARRCRRTEARNGTPRSDDWVELATMAEANFRSFLRRRKYSRTCCPLTCAPTKRNTDSADESWANVGPLLKWHTAMLSSNMMVRPSVCRFRNRAEDSPHFDLSASKEESSRCLGLTPGLQPHGQH
jgi:hypothetical protein